MGGIHGAFDAGNISQTGTIQTNESNFDQHISDAVLTIKTQQNTTLPDTQTSTGKTSTGVYDLRTGTGLMYTETELKAKINNIIELNNTATDGRIIEYNFPMTPSTTATGTSTVDVTRLPIGGIVSNTVNTTGAVKGQVYVSPQSYNVMQNGSTGNVATGAWINADGKTYDATKKEVVSGAVTWPYQYSTTENSATRTITGNTLPSTTTGTYPIDPTTVAYTIDPNPNTIESENYTISMPSNPQAATTASPLGLGPVGVMTNGGLLYAGVDGKGNDANAYEVQDENVGHPSETDHYHTHEIPPILYSEIVGQPYQTKLVGYAADGYAIVAETGSDGKLLSTSQLDEFHGNTSTYVDENGKSVTAFHYTVSQDWPYTIGAFKGTPSTFEGLNTVPTITTPTTPPPPPPLGYEPVGLYWDAGNSKLYAKIGSEWVQGAIVDQAGQYVDGMGYVATQNGPAAPTGDVKYIAADGRVYGITVNYNQGPQQRDTLFQATYGAQQGTVSSSDADSGLIDFRVGNTMEQGRFVDSTGQKISADGYVRVYEEGVKLPVGDTYFATSDGRYLPVYVTQANPDAGVAAAFYKKLPIA